MKKVKLLTTVLWVSMGCVANMSTAAVNVSSKSTQKNITESHKKNKTVQHRKITEKDIAECTRLINKVTKIERMPQKEVMAITASNTKIARPEDVQLFSSDNPVVSTHLTGKTVNLSVAPAPIGQIAQVTKITPIVTSSPKLIAKLTVPPVDKQVVKPIIPVNPQIFSSDTPQKVGVQIAKIQSTKPLLQEQSTPQSSIKLFVPNTTPVDFNHLKGGSASLDIIKKTAPINKPVTAQKKTTQVTATSKKPKSTVVINSKIKKSHS